MLGAWPVLIFLGAAVSLVAAFEAYSGPITNPSRGLDGWTGREAAVVAIATAAVALLSGNRRRGSRLFLPMVLGSGLLVTIGLGPWHYLLDLLRLGVSPIPGRILLSAFGLIGGGIIASLGCVGAGVSLAVRTPVLVDLDKSPSQTRLSPVGTSKTPDTRLAPVEAAPQTSGQLRNRDTRARRWAPRLAVLVALIVPIALVEHYASAKSTGVPRGAIPVTPSSGNPSANSTTGETSTTTGTNTTVPGSAAGKPCVAVSSSLPPGAPTVPVKVGPPPSQLVKQDLKIGTGAVVTPNATVTVNYIGVACSTGKIFDSSYSRHQSFTTPLAHVVPGWTHGIPGMRVGGERLLGIPPALAYGTQSPGNGIAPDETLWFVVQVLQTS